ncbi:MAG: hypothetical protein EPO21_03875 [Chloroflexota bacterium]|nr:MAG: hypothetical protein EPO21_03875 [Chloroflexota bacterium]
MSANTVVGRTADSRAKGLLLVIAMIAAALLLFAMAGTAQADDPVPSSTPDPVAAPLPAPTVIQEHRTYNVFNFPVIGDVLDAVLKGLSDSLRKGVQPTFGTLSLILKTPTLASDGQSGGDQLNFYAIVEPLWRLATLPMAGLLGFVLLLYSGVAMQVSAASRSARGVGANMEGLVATLGGIVLAAFSLQAFHLANEAGNVLVDMIMQAPGPGQGTDLSLMAASVLSGAGIAGPLGTIITGVILLIPTLLLVMMAVARWALFFVVAVLSPLAAVALGSAPTKRLASLWVQMFLFVMLLGPVNAILLRSIQALYGVALGSLGHLEDVPRAVASGAVMFGLLSMAGALNYAAIQKAFGVALGWVSTGVSVAVGAVAFAGAAAGGVAAGGGLAALGTSLGSLGGKAMGVRDTASGDALASAAIRPSPGNAGPWGTGLHTPGLTAEIGSLDLGKGQHAEESSDGAGETPEDWRRQYRSRRREGFDWNRAATVGGSLAALAPGFPGRMGMAARLLGMSGMVEERFNRGVAERDLAREEARERSTLADLQQQRSLIFGRPSGPEQVERANAIDRAVATVARRTADHEGLRGGLANLGRSALSQSAIGDPYGGVAGLGGESGGNERSRIERTTGLYLESELMSRGSLRGEPVYAMGEEGTDRMNSLVADGLGRSLGLGNGVDWQSAGSTDGAQLRAQTVALVERLRAVGQLPQGRAYAEELGRDPHLAGSTKALSLLESYVTQLEQSRATTDQPGKIS